MTNGALYEFFDVTKTMTSFTYHGVWVYPPPLLVVGSTHEDTTCRFLTMNLMPSTELSSIAFERRANDERATEPGPRSHAMRFPGAAGTFHDGVPGT
jgi:hypothetical protein